MMFTTCAQYILYTLNPVVLVALDYMNSNHVNVNSNTNSIDINTNTNTNNEYTMDLLVWCVNSIVPLIFVILLLACLCIIKIALGIFLLYYCSYIQQSELDQFHQEEEKAASGRSGR